MYNAPPPPIFQLTFHTKSESHDEVPVTTMSTPTTDGAAEHNPSCRSGAVWSPGWSHLPHSTADGDGGVAVVRAWGPGTPRYEGLSGYEVSVFSFLNEVSLFHRQNPLPIRHFTEGSDAGRQASARASLLTGFAVFHRITNKQRLI